MDQYLYPYYRRDVELQQSLGKNLIVNNHLLAVRPNIWSPPQPPQADIVLTSVALLSIMREYTV